MTTNNLVSADTNYTTKGRMSDRVDATHLFCCPPPPLTTDPLCSLQKTMCFISNTHESVDIWQDGVQSYFLYGTFKRLRGTGDQPGPVNNVSGIASFRLDVRDTSQNQNQTDEDILLLPWRQRRAVKRAVTWTRKGSTRDPTLPSIPVQTGSIPSSLQGDASWANPHLILWYTLLKIVNPFHVTRRRMM